MAHFAKINKDGLVMQVIVAERQYVESREDADTWIQTSYNTCAGKHLQAGEPLRKNFAGIGYTYIRALDMFIPPKPTNKHVLDLNTGTWSSKDRRPRTGEPLPGVYSFELKDENGKKIYETIEEGPNKADRKRIPVIVSGIVLDVRK